MPRKLPKAVDDVQALIKRTDIMNPRPDDVEALRRLLREKPEKWRETGDLLEQARRQYVQKCDATAFTKEVIALRCEQMKKELVANGDSELELLLIDQIVFAWLRLSFIEYQYNHVWNSPNGVSFERGLFWEKRLSSAQKRFQQACVSLARVRKLMKPPKAKLLVGTVNALLSGRYADDTLGALMARKPGNSDS